MNKSCWVLLGSYQNIPKLTPRVMMGYKSEASKVFHLFLSYVSSLFYLSLPSLRQAEMSPHKICTRFCPVQGQFSSYSEPQKPSSLNTHQFFPCCCHTPSITSVPQQLLIDSGSKHQLRAWWWKQMIKVNHRRIYLMIQWDWPHKYMWIVGIFTCCHLFCSFGDYYFCWPNKF